ncbi:MAG: hypothetical protein QME60_09260 [Verrucomicrobiota bacterium]|nr:hypothetical protein [Verrucomicrobiota bacterium]
MCGVSCPESGDETMNIRSVLLAMVFLPVAVAVAAETTLPPGFADAIAKTGKPYRDAVAVVINDANAAKHLDRILHQESADSVNARHARILVARIQHPEVFAEFANQIQKWREGEKSSQPRGGRPGFLSGLLLSYVGHGPESKYVYVRDEAEDKRHSGTNGLTIRGLHRKQVEKYTDAEVQAGIARNAAARQAVLEHFLKFLDEGDAYEQSEMVELVNRLWGRDRSKRTGDLAAIDHVDADALMEGVFGDASRPAAARMRAAFCLADAKPPEVRAFMLNVVTNTPADDMYRQSEDMVSGALAYLETSADANTLAVLKNQTNGPAWKREKIEKTNHAIEGRLSASPKDK